jgi:hypothetical protein
VTNNEKGGLTTPRGMLRDHAAFAAIPSL